VRLRDVKLPFEIPEAPDEEARRRRAVALGALVAAFVLLVLAIGLATCGGGGSDNAGERAATTQQPKAPAKKPKRRSKPAAVPGAVPPTAPGAHKDPKAAVPILMYHLVNTPPPDTAEPELWVPRADFEAQMKYLADQGYHGVTLQQVWDAWHKGGLLPSKPIVISFDDGYHSQYSNAFPILRSHGWPGVLNMQVNQLREDLKPDEVKAMIAAGWELDAHTISHPDLTTVDSSQLDQEVTGSRQQLQRQFGAPVNFFCYPAGRFDATVEEAVKAAGYLGATTTQLGVAKPDENPYELPRVRVNGSDGVDGMARSLSGAEAGQTGGDQGGE
jgi:peptidoglycan/xylan/chitin deacetylase (PgdA/CDA1 family)